MASIETAKGQRIFYDERGSGPALLLIAGRIVSRRGWELQVPTFAERFRTLTIDNRDAGESDPATADYLVSDLAADCVALLDALGIDRAHILGHSMGSGIAARLVVDHPERVERLILASGALFGPPAPGSPPPSFPRADWIEDPVERRRLRAVLSAAPGYFEAHPERHALVTEQERGNRITYEGVNRQARAMVDYPTRAQLAAITAPTLVIHGDQDGLIPLERGQELAASIPGAHLLILPGVGHSPHIERTAEFDRAVLDFLAGQPVGDPV
jgi:3-oxoadipate enol-lactonase